MFSRDEVVFSVTEISQRVKSILESGIGFVTVEGEVGSCTPASSKHWYITLKDTFSQATLKAVFFHYSRPPHLAPPTVGQRVRVSGRLTAYGQQSSYQMTLDSLRSVGEGELLLQLEALKRKLYEEGLFDGQRKRSLPPFPQSVGIITSAEGKVFHDICSRFRLHGWPFRLILLPCAVQGAEAAASIVRRIQQANTHRLCDVLIVCRGGGSAEDLLPYSDEAVVRAVAASEIPIISAVGHEPDSPLCDFSADHRSGTPTAAADDICIPLQRTRKNLDDINERLSLALRVSIQRQRSLWERFSPQRLREAFVRQLQNPAQQLDRLKAQLHPAGQALLVQKRSRLEVARLRLEKDSPTYPLSKGYALVHDQEGRILTQAKELLPHQKITLQFNDGSQRAIVEEMQNEGL